VLSVELVVGCGKEWRSYLDVIKDYERWEEMLNKSWELEGTDLLLL